MSSLHPLARLHLARKILTACQVEIDKALDQLLSCTAEVQEHLAIPATDQTTMPDAILARDLIELTARTSQLEALICQLLPDAAPAASADEAEDDEQDDQPTAAQAPPSDDEEEDDKPDDQPN